MFTKKKIIFNTFLGKGAESFLNVPLPSKKLIPDWYKKMETLHQKDPRTPTIKKCMPVLDALSMGYIISTGWDIYLKKYQEEGVWKLKIEYPPMVDDILRDIGHGIEVHSPNQFAEDGYNSDEIHLAAKILNPWVITTPPGYSCMFISPLNHTSPHYRPFSGVVDTDVHRMPINFPGAFKKFEGLTKTIPSGIPLIMVIPFKRDNWRMETNFKTTGDPGHRKGRLTLFKNMFDNYKQRLWNKKNFD